MYGINSMEESATKICATIQDQPAEHAVVVMAHNGPSGLGSEQHDICGKDWSDKAGETLLMIFVAVSKACELQTEWHL